MSIDDVIETIEFPNPINSDCAELLLDYITEQLGYDIKFYNANIEPKQDTFFYPSGCISELGDVYKFDFKSSKNNENLFLAMQLYNLSQSEVSQDFLNQIKSVVGGYLKTVDNIHKIKRIISQVDESYGK
jgi:hypothetical protein